MSNTRDRQEAKLLTWVVAVMDNTKVGTVEQLRFNRRPWEKNTLYGLKVPLTFKCRELCPWLINVSWGNKHSISLTSIITFWWFWYIIKLRSFLRFQLHPLSFKKSEKLKIPLVVCHFKAGPVENHCFGNTTSANRMTLFPSGQMMWSTWERTLSQVSSGLRRLACRHKGPSVLQY